MKGKPRWAVNVRTDIEASDEWLALLTRGERGDARAIARLKRPGLESPKGSLIIKAEGKAYHHR